MHTKTFIVLAALVLTMPQTQLHAQDETPTISFPPATAIVGAPMISGANFTFFGQHMPDDALGLLKRKQIQEEVGLSEDQITVVGELQKDIQRQMAEFFQTQAKFGGDAANLMESATKAVRKKVEAELANVLSPKQMKRLREVEVQMKIKNRGVLALLDDKMTAALEISDDQKKEIKEQQRERQKELMAQIEKLREQFREELIKDVLSKKQLRALEDLSGDDYDVKQPNFRRFQAPAPQ